MEEFMAEYAHKDSRVYKLKQDGTTIFLPGISDRKGLDKVPFAFNFQGKEITKKEAQKYYSYSKTIEEILKNPKKKKKKIFTTFFGHIYYSNHNENPAMKLITSIESIFSLYIFSFLEYPLSGLCPDCGEEVIFEYRKIHKGRIPQNFFSHKQTSVSKKHCDFVYETGKHLKARWAVAEAIEKEEDICLLRKCSKCHKISKQYFPIKSFKSSLTHILPSGHRADVALFDKDDNLKTIIEIIDEKTIPPEKENDLKDISWGEFTAETILGSNNWLVKRDFFKAYICPKCKEIQNKDIPKTITQNPPIPTGTGKIRLESENYYFEIKLLLKEEFRYSPEMINLVIKELEEFWCFKVTKIQVFYTDGSSKNIYTYDYSEKLPSDKDDMVVVSFILNSYYHYGSYRVGHYLNALWQNPNKLPHPSKDSRIQSMSGIYLPYKDQKTLIKLLSILSRFFLMPKEEEIQCIDFYECKYGGYHSRKYRKKKKGTSRYSIPHENAYDTEIEKVMEKALVSNNIKFKKQHTLYTNDKLFTIVDFYIEENKIAIYCDGFKYHYNKENVIKDRYQDRELQYLGYKVLRFTGSEIVGDIEKCISHIQKFIRKFSEGN